MHTNATVLLRRDVNALSIPEGSPTTLRKGEFVSIFQALGGHYTVNSETQGLVRIAKADADALGQTANAEELQPDTLPQSLEDRVWEALRSIYDPEIPVNIVELGLVYYVRITPVLGDLCDVDVVMTLTAPGCGMGPVLQRDAEEGIKRLVGVRRVAVEVVFDPPWSYDMMSDAARLQLGML